MCECLEDTTTTTTTNNTNTTTITTNNNNTEKSPGDLRKLAVIQSPVKDHQLTLM